MGTSPAYFFFFFFFFFRALPTHMGGSQASGLIGALPPGSRQHPCPPLPAPHPRAGSPARETPGLRLLTPPPPPPPGPSPSPRAGAGPGKHRPWGEASPAGLGGAGAAAPAAGPETRAGPGGSELRAGRGDRPLLTSPLRRRSACAWTRPRRCGPPSSACSAPSTTASRTRSTTGSFSRPPGAAPASSWTRSGSCRNTRPTWTRPCPTWR